MAFVWSNKPSFPMDHSNNEMDQLLLQAIDTSKVPGYQEFMHDLIVEDISNLDSELWNVKLVLVWMEQTSIWRCLWKSYFLLWHVWDRKDKVLRELSMSRQWCELFYRLERNRLKTWNNVFEPRREKQRRQSFTIIPLETLICCVSIAKDILKLCKPWI